MISSLLRLIKKDLLFELRKGETLIAAISFALLLSTLIGFSIQNAFLEPSSRMRILPSLIWVLFIFTSTMSFSRAYAFETKARAIDAIILTGIPLSSFFLAKCFVFFCFGCIIHTLQTLCLSGLFQAYNLLNIDFFLLSLLVIVAFVPLFTLLLAIADNSKLGSMLLPIILIPLLFPLFFAASELSQQLIIQGALDFSSFWFSLICALDILYLTLGISLYPSVSKG